MFLLGLWIFLLSVQTEALQTRAQFLFGVSLFQELALPLDEIVEPHLFM